MAGKLDRRLETCWIWLGSISPGSGLVEGPRFTYNIREGKGVLA